MKIPLKISIWILFMCVIQTSPLPGAGLVVRVVDSDTGDLLSARVYVERVGSVGDSARHIFLEPLTDDGFVVRYDKVNWLNENSFERYVSIPAEGGRAEISEGTYRVSVEKGKEYLPAERVVELRGDQEIRIGLRRWINMSDQGWYSGEMHIHRSIEELRHVMLVEDLNVAFPLTQWVTRSGLDPASGNKNQSEVLTDGLIAVDDQHVIWPRNTEYEIFSVNGRQHTLGALFVLGHRSGFQKPVPPWAPVGEKARAESALMDMDKLDWPFSMVLPQVTGARLYELANNHMWRTGFAFRDWNSEAPDWMQPPRGGRSGGEWDWIQYTFGMYYTLLNAGHDLLPAAGTASGVHPVPVGFSRLYVPLPDGFSYDKYIEAVRKGSGFVTTGPMMMVRADGHWCGHKFEIGNGSHKPIHFTGEILSQNKISFVELVENGIPVRTIMGENRATGSGGFRTGLDFEYEVKSTGWLALRCYEDMEGGRIRFAHTGRWKFGNGIPESGLRPEEKKYLVGRIQDEISRSSEFLDEPSLKEYADALGYYESLEAGTENPLGIESRWPQNPEQMEFWLRNAIVDHGFSEEETSLALGLPSYLIPELPVGSDTDEAGAGRLKVLPYPGGRHPRTGFLDGAVNPQRDTKFSVFVPWDTRSYVVVDLPEAIWSNLGLTYLAHTHIPTVWGNEHQDEKLEWEINPESGELTGQRFIPDRKSPVLQYRTRVVPGESMVAMGIQLTNHSSDTLTNLRAQVCNHLKGALGWHEQVGSNKVVSGSWIACGNEEGTKWVLTSWRNQDRAWHNPPVPCIHSDPSFPDCGPGETVRARGLIKFHEGTDIEDFLEVSERDFDRDWRRLTDKGNQ